MLASAGAFIKHICLYTDTSYRVGLLPLKEMAVSGEFKCFLTVSHSLRRLRKA